MCLFLLFGPLVPALMSGCAQVRLIENAPEAAVVSIPNNTNQWPTYYRNRAEVLMERKFPEGYTIVNEQTVEDNPAARDGRKPNEDFDYNGAIERVTRYNRKEFHITFRRGVTAKGAPSRAGLPAKNDREDELPPPRLMPSDPPKAKRTGSASDSN
jgi:hypothetical protein